MNAPTTKGVETTNDAFTTSKINSQSQLDVIYEFAAPENVSFKYRVAGPFSRAYAYSLDLLFMFAYWSGSMIAVLLFLDYLIGYDGVFGWYTELKSTLFSVFFYVNTTFVFWFWTVLFEAFWQGRTLGKAIVGLRVISCSGRPLRFSQAFVRNVLRLADFMLGPFVTLIMGANERMARLGDVASDTVVIVARGGRNRIKRDKKGVPIVKEPFDEKLLSNVASKTPEDFIISDSLRKALDLYVARRADLAPQRRLEIASVLADRLQEKARVSPRLNPDAFLYALHKKSLGVERQAY